MNRTDFEEKFLKLLNILIETENVQIPHFLLPNGEFISISVNSLNGSVKCYRGSFMIYRYLTYRKDRDHLKILAEYIYRHHDDRGLKKILNDLKIETVKQI